MPGNSEILLCQYNYDPLDRLVNCTLSAQASTQRFYLKDRLATEIQGAVQWSIVQHGDQLLAQQQRQNQISETNLLITDQQRSVLNLLAVTGPHLLSYTPYGHRPPEKGLLSLIGFNGERADPLTGQYLLGNGYRAFNPVLMRFNSPDSWSPFGEGGLNMYTYCGGEPVNRSDRTGHTWSWIKSIMRSLNLMKPSARGAELTRTFSVTSLGPWADENPVKYNPLYQSPRSSISPQPSTSTITSDHYVDSVYNQPLTNSENRIITPRTGTLPPLPPNARLHTQWSLPQPVFRPHNIYDLPSMATIYETPGESLRHLNAEKVVRTGKSIRYT